MAEDKTGGPASVIEEIAAERQRQINVEGWSSEHDDAHTNGEMANAAACYAATKTIYKVEMMRKGRDSEPKPRFEDNWPWHSRWWKPKDPRRDLIRAGALIVAEIERLDRLAEKAKREASNADS